MTSTIQQFHRLAATAAPRMNVTVSRTETLEVAATSTAIRTSYTITGKAADLARPVEITTQTSEVDAINQFNKAKARAYRVKDVNRILDNLKADWSDEERDAIHDHLLQVSYYSFKAEEAKVVKADQERYDALMHQDYEAKGGYDAE